MPLSDARLRTLKPTDRPYKVSDGEGLYVYVTPAGVKSWRLAYRFGGKQKTLVIGTYPQTGLSAARDARDAAKGLLEKQRDPGVVKKLRKIEIASGASTFRVFAGKFLATVEAAWTPRYHASQTRRLEVDVYPVIGGLPIGEIEPPIMLGLLQAIEKREALFLSRKVKTLCSQVFRYAIAAGALARDPTADLKGALKPQPKYQHFARVEVKDVPKLFVKIHAYEGDAHTRLGLRLALHTLTRTDELRFAALDEFQLDGSEPVWRIAGERMKMGRPHIVPLSRQAVEIVRAIKPVVPRSTLLFGAFTKSGTISENTWLHALWKQGYYKTQTVHGFRGLGSTVLNEQGFNGDWIERQLAHDEEDKVRAAYNAAQFLPQRRQMMQWWSDWIDAQTHAGDRQLRKTALIG